jgi:flavin-binding protein dodecin
MSVAKVIEVIGKSEKSWQDAVQQAVKEASKTVKNISCVDVVKQTANIKNGKITEYKANCKIAFVVER